MTDFANFPRPGETTHMESRKYKKISSTVSKQSKSSGSNVVICDPEVCFKIHYFLGVSKFADIRDSFKHSQVEQIQIFPEVLLLFPDFQMEDI